MHVPRRFRLCLLIALSSLACSRQIPTKGAARVEDLKLPGDYADCLIVDLNGDSISEIIALVVSDTGGGSDATRKGLVIPFAGDGYNSAQAVEFAIPPDAVLFDTGNIDGDSLPEILYLAPAGVFAMDYDGEAVGPPRQILAQTSVFTLPTMKSVSGWDLYLEIDPGRALVMVPCLKGITAYHFQEVRFDSLNTLRFPQLARAGSGPLSELRHSSPLTYSYSLPSIHLGDYDADGLPDIFVVADNRVLVFPGRLEGRFPDEPAVVFGDDYARQIRDDDPNASILYQIEDINDDGRDDIVVSKNSGGVTSNKTEIGVHICRPREGYERQPSYSRIVAKSAGVAYINDFNGDGRLDLAVPALELGVVAVIKMLILNSLNIDIEIFLQGAGAVFPAKPSLTKSISSAVDLNAGNIQYGETMAFGGDFNGDRRADFLTDTGRGLLKIFFGDPEHLLAQNSGWSIKIPPPRSIYATDLNHDGRDEILAFYGPASAETDIIRVIWVGETKK